MSNNNGGGWKPRKVVKLTCPSGQEVSLRRPDPSFMLKAGKVARTFTMSAVAMPDKADDQSMEEYGMQVVSEMSDEEQDALEEYAGKLIVASVVSPRLVLDPDPDKDEIGPKDLGYDFWFIFNYAMRNFMGIKVPVGSGDMESEVSVSDLESFRGESGVQGDGVDGVHVSVAEPERAATDSGLVNSAGA